VRDLLVPQSWAFGLDDARAFFDSYEDLFDDHIDEFSRLAPLPGHHPPSRKTLHRLLVSNTEVFGRCLWLSLSRLVATTIEPYASAPGRMCARMIGGLLSAPASAVTCSLMTRMQSARTQEWTTVITALTEVERETRGWSTWPSSAACEHALASIDAIMPVWSAEVTQLQNELRTSRGWKGRNHSFRRAARQWELIAKVLRTIAVPRGPPAAVRVLALGVAAILHRTLRWLDRRW
jgi:hypothetical protein